MQGKSLFLNRAISRSNEWQCRFPALRTAWQDPGSLSRGRQVVAATADIDGIRCAFFSSLGPVLDFSASWRELDRARTWWHFTIRWNFWLISDSDSLAAMRAAGYDPAQRELCEPASPLDRYSDDSFTAFLDQSEARFRLDGRLLLPLIAARDQRCRTDAI